MNVKIFRKLLLFSILLIGAIGTVEAIPIMSSPTASQNITNAAPDTAICDTSIYANVTNMSFEYFTAGTGWTVIGLNTTPAFGTNFTFALTGASATDGQHTMRCVGNKTGDNTSYSANTTLVGFDDTGPTITMTALVDATIGTASTITANCTDVNFNHEGCDNCNYTQVPDSSNLGDCLTGCAMTGSGTTFTYSYTPTVYGIKSSFVECDDDRAQSTNSTPSDIQVNSRGSGMPPGYGPETTTAGTDAGEQEAKDRRNRTLIYAIAGALVVISVIYAKTR